MSSERPAAVTIPRLPAPGTVERRSLRPADLGGLNRDDRAAVEQLLALASLDDD